MLCSVKKMIAQTCTLGVFEMAYLDECLEYEKRALNARIHRQVRWLPFAYTREYPYSFYGYIMLIVTSEKADANRYNRIE